MTFTTFIKRPVLSTVISILIVLLGFIGLASLPIEQYPDIAPPTVVVYTSYPGADAETVKNSVIVPLEESINGVEGMDYLSSTASSGSASTGWLAGRAPTRTVTVCWANCPESSSARIEMRTSVPASAPMSTPVWTR